MRYTVLSTKLKFGHFGYAISFKFSGITVFVVILNSNLGGDWM